MSEPQLQHQIIKIRQLIDDYRIGKIVIPEFQREYVWKPGKAPHLIDSLYKGFPISSLLLWQSTDEIKARRRDPRPGRGSINWLIDGQQRMITMARTLAGDEGIDVIFHPDDEVFRLSNAATKNDRNWFRVAEIWDDELYRQLRRNLDGGRIADRREQRFEKLRKVLDYEIPLVRMIDHSFKDAVEAFTRINTLGVKLKREDIASAQVAAQHSGFIAEGVSPYLEELRAQGFTRMNVMHLFRACAFVAQPDGRNRTPLHELESKVVLNAWADTKRATGEALDLIRSELGLVNMSVLWSGALVVPVIALCATLAPKHRDAPGIAAWLALAALVHRYSGATETALDQDLRACRSSDPLGALLSNLRQERPSLTATPEDFEGFIADRSALLAMYIACRHRGILDFYTGAKIFMQKSIDRHHIMPRSQFDAPKRAQADCIANIAFISGDVNKSIGQAGPEVYLKSLKSKVLMSQCVPTDPGLWFVESAPEFWQTRKELLAEAFNEFVREALPNRKL